MIIKATLITLVVILVVVITTSYYVNKEGFDDITNNVFPELYDFIKEIEKNKTYKIDYLSSSESRGYAFAVKL